MAYGGLDAFGQPKNRFPGSLAYNLQNNKYYAIVSDDGIIQIYRDQSVSGVSLNNPSIGTYNTKTNQFTFTKGQDGKVDSRITPLEQQYFSSQAGRAQVKTAGQQTVSQSVVDSKGTPQQAQQTASQVVGAATTTGGEITPGPTTSESLSKGVQYGAYRTEYPILRYPLDRKEDQDYIQFTMYRYEPRPVDVTQAEKDSGSILGDRKNLNDRKNLGYVTLPIQPSISDLSTVNWGDLSLNAIEAAAAMLSLNMITKGAEGAKEAADAAPKIATSGQVKALAGYGLAAAAVGNQGANLLTRATGGIVNPNTELLFQGPQLRGFSFNFSLSAREPKEAKIIKQIIRFFKQGMSVKKSTTSLFLMSPNTFGIKYVYGKNPNQDHPWINQIKECALQSCSVNYTPEQSYSTYPDGAMTKYDISLTFSELDPIYDDDYKKLDSDTNDPDKAVIGY